MLFTCIEKCQMKGVNQRRINSGGPDWAAERPVGSVEGAETTTFGRTSFILSENTVNTPHCFCILGDCAY